MYLHTIKEKNVYRHFYNVFCFCLSWLIRKPSRMAFPRQGRTLLEVFLFSLLLLSLISFSRGTFEGEVEYDDEDSTGCSPCEPGTFYNPNKVNQTEDKCSGCTEGTCVTPQCYSCPNGTSQGLSGQSSCTPCPENYISNGVSCLPCGPGTQPDQYLTSCEPCQLGYFNNITSGGTCIACTAGSFSPNASACVPCGAGTYNQVEASHVCRVCTPGFYNPRPGSALNTSCLACTPGTYCKSQSTSAPVVCPQNFYCPARSSQPIPCGWLTSSHVGASECEYKTMFYVVIGLAGAAVFLIVVAAVVLILRRRDTVKEIPDTAELIPQSLPGPVYSGY